MIDPARVSVRRLTTPELTADAERDVRRLLDEAFAGADEGDFTDDDWQHSVGGTHFLLELDGALVGTAAVVERTLEIDGLPIRTGYVEAVAIAPGCQRRGLGTLLVRNLNAHIVERFELGALGTGSVAFYERLGWRVWRGPTSVRTPEGLQRTPDEDGYILVLLTPTSPPVTLTEPISCAVRPGDSW